MSTIGTNLYLNLNMLTKFYIYMLGYGDISPNTILEKIYGVFISLISCGIFAFAVNMIGKLIFI